MIRRALVLTLIASSAFGAETTVLPKGTFVLDVAYLYSTINKRWDGNRQGVSLIDDIPRYEPGGGLQGTLSVNPSAAFRITVFQLLYGITDWLTAAVYVPLVLSTTVNANFHWTPGDYQGQLGRSYSEDDFWAWAGSLGQPRPPNKWSGNKYTLADMVLALRAKVPRFSWLKKLGLEVGGTLSVALPTGTPVDPEEVVAAGTTSFDLHAYGDVEAHLSWDRPFFVDEYDIPRVNLGGDFFFSWFRPKTYATATGVRNPLLNTYAPYVGASYTIDPGDWAGATLSLDVSPFLGPTFATIVSGHDLARAHGLPAMVTLNVGYTYVATGQSRWYSDSLLWSYDREKFWLPGDKNIFRFGLTISLLRLGIPVQLYGQYRSQDLLPGRYTRPSNVISGGARVIAKFW